MHRAVAEEPVAASGVEAPEVIAIAVIRDLAGSVNARSGAAGVDIDVVLRGQQVVVITSPRKYIRRTPK